MKGYDYNQNGAYFITICVKGRHEVLGTVVGRGDLDTPCVQLSECGLITKKNIELIGLHYIGVTVDQYVIMPNHLHMIISICRDESTSDGENGASRSPRPTNAVIPNIMKAFKNFTNKAVGFSLWQDSFHDRVIRDEAEYRRIWQYIDENPARWEEDGYYRQGEQVK